MQLFVKFSVYGILVTCLFTTNSLLLAQDKQPENWPRFHGPNHNGVAENATPPVEFGLDKNLKWKVEIPGKGHSSPVIWNDRIYMMTAINTANPSNAPAAAAPARTDAPPGSDRAQGGRGGRGGGGGGRGAAPTTPFDFAVVCVDRNSGSIVWNKTVTSAVPHEGGHGTNTYASGSPVTDGKHLWCNFGSNGVYCLDMEGNVVWHRDLGKMTTRASFGEGASVAVHGDTVVIPWDHEQDSFILAVDALTGKDKWKTARDEPTTWSSPVIAEHNGVTQVITNGSTRVRSYNLADGKLIWECSGQASNPCPTPLLGEGVIYCMTGYQGFAIQAISLDAIGDVSNGKEILWSREDAAPYVATGTLYKGTIYLTKSREGVLSAVESKSGDDVIAQTRLPGIQSIYASLVAANDHIYVCGREGEVVVLKHGTRFDVAHQTNLGEPLDATPAISGNQLFIRGEKNLYCFENGK